MKPFPRERRAPKPQSGAFGSGAKKWGARRFEFFGRARALFPDRDNLFPAFAFKRETAGAMNSILVRPATRQDIPRVFELVCELAEFENARDQVETTPEILERDGFGATPLFGLLVAERDGEVVGMALTYFRFSTWKGKRLYLEDLVVTESARGRGVGRALLEATIQLARDLNCTGLMWQVLDWNKSAIEFYQRFDVRLEEQWLNVHLDL